MSDKGSRVRAGYHISIKSAMSFCLFPHHLCMSGLPKGLYFLVRNEEHFDALQYAMRQDFEWVRPEGCPDCLPLYKLMKGDC